jgi:hypothetical protein
MITNRGLKTHLPFIRSSKTGVFLGHLGCQDLENASRNDVIGLLFTSAQGTLELLEQLERVPFSKLVRILRADIDDGTLD